MSTQNTLLRAAVMAALVSSLAACGGGGAGGSSTPISTAVKAPLLIRDAADEMQSSFAEIWAVG